MICCDYIDYMVLCIKSQHREYDMFCTETITFPHFLDWSQKVKIQETEPYLRFHSWNEDQSILFGWRPHRFQYDNRCWWWMDTWVVGTTGVPWDRTRQLAGITDMQRGGQIYTTTARNIFDLIYFFCHFFRYIWKYLK